MIYTQLSICPGEWHINSYGILTHEESPNLGQTTRPYNNQQRKKRTCKTVDVDVLAAYRIKVKESEKKDMYLDLAKELKKLWNMKVTIIPFVIGTFGTVTKGLLKGLEDLEFRGRVETIETTALLRTTRILRRILKTWGDLLSLKILWKTSTKQHHKDFVKVRIDKKQNSRCRLCGDRDETINHISECRKLAQKEYKTRHDWVGKIISRELRKKVKFDHKNKWYMHNPESVQEN